MFGFLSNMASAAVKVVATPITVVADLAAAPFTADGRSDHPMIATEALLKSAARDFNKAVK